MWLVMKDGKPVMRHFCENSNDLKSFGWKEHNGRDFGRQELFEQDMVLETSFVKSEEGSLGYGGDWSIRINVQNMLNDDEVKRSTHLFFYLADEGCNGVNLGKDVLRLKESSVLASGSRQDVGNWQMHLKSQVTFDLKLFLLVTYCFCKKITIVSALRLQNHLETHYCGFKTPDIVNLSGLVQQNLTAQVIFNISILLVSKHVFFVL